ncbi:MAG: fatty acyl-AMP ligase [Chloroflexi bacterium]|nr:fatty acyl-AMP ligase [Chloroflexota bacterium]
MKLSNIPTLIDLLAYRARKTGVIPAYTYRNQPAAYRELWDGVNRFAAYLQSLNLQRYDRILLALPNGHEFFHAFYGVQRAGGTAVPIFPGFSPDRILTMAELCGASIVVLPSDMSTDTPPEPKAALAGHNLRLITVAESQPFPTEGDFPHIEPDDLAFIQYTSGSVGNPKGVQLSHSNLLTNVRQMIAGMEITEREIFVSWLPVYHDMGLILKTMVPFYLGAMTHLLPTSLANIRDWLDAIQAHRATFTAAPDFAYRLAVKRIANSGDYDLSSLRVALNAAEPVRARTIRDFEAAFGLKNVMVAGYGLAEATVGVSMQKPGSPPVVDKRGIVAVGRPFPHIKITILQDNQPAPVGEVGEIAIHSPANTRGYFNNPTAIERLFWHDPDNVIPAQAGIHTSTNVDSRLRGNDSHGSYIRSGDLGYLDDDGRLTIVSRKKNIIIHAGHTVYPQEIEEVAGDVPGVRFAAAVGIDRGGVEGEQAYVFSEVRGRDPDVWHDTAIEIVDRFYGRFGFRPGRVYLVKPKSIPQTHNGKIQHLQLKDDFLTGRLRENGRILFP